jgi:hypothetical protein
LAWQGVQVQIKAQAEFEKERRRARLEAERAVLGAKLRVIMHAADLRISELVVGGFGFNVPELERGDLETFKACIEVSEGEAKLQLIGLIAVFEAAQSINRHLADDQSNQNRSLMQLLEMDEQGPSLASHDRVTAVFRWTAVWARANNLIDFAYGVDEVPSWDGIQDSFERKVKFLTDQGVDSGFSLRNFSEYARRTADVTGGNSYSMCRKDWWDYG